jgi:hypothetical protein
VPQIASAEGLVRVRVGAASTDYDLEFDGGPYAGRKAKSSYTAKALGLTYVAESGFYIDVLGQTSGDATHDLWKPRPDQKFSRDDFTLTLGVSFPSQSGSALSVFGGLKSGSSELTAPPGVFSWSKDVFESTGIFFGLGYGFPALGGQFGLNGALAFMSGTWKDDAGFNNDADYTVGFSLGLSYTYTFGKNFGVIADAKVQNYSYDFAVYSTTTPAYTVTENISSLGLSLFAQF